MCKYEQFRASQVVLVVGDMRNVVQSWVREIPWRRAQQPTLVFLPGKSHGQRSFVGYSP